MNASELITNKDGSIYHLGLHPEQVAQTIITVGDPERVEAISKYFESVEHKVQNREFVTHTGRFRGKTLTVISTGIGTDNVDIVFNEVHALANLDLKTGLPKQDKKSLDFIRIGTSGAVQTDIPVGGILLSEMAIGFDGLMHFYDVPEEEDLLQELYRQWPEIEVLSKPYFAQADKELSQRFAHLASHRGITLTAPGFYAPQGRSVNLATRVPNFIEHLGKVRFAGKRITNIEMETAGIYGLAKAMGHRAVSISALLANRATGAFAENPGAIVEQLIEDVLDILAQED